MLKAIIVGFFPYVVMLVGVPFANSTGNVGGLPVLALWILLWVLLTPLFLLAAFRQLPRAEREEGGR